MIVKTVVVVEIVVVVVVAAVLKIHVTRNYYVNMINGGARSGGRANSPMTC